MKIKIQSIKNFFLIKRKKKTINYLKPIFFESIGDQNTKEMKGSRI